MSGNPWDDLRAALSMFLSDQDSEGLYVAMSYFSIADDGGPFEPTCSGLGYTKPIVDWGLLPQHATVIETALSAVQPDGLTPTQDALNGLLEGVKTRQANVPNNSVWGVLMSDGEPCCDDCPIEDAFGLGQIAAQYAHDTPPARVFTVYLNDSASDVMQEIAVNGDTGVAALGGTMGMGSVVEALNMVRDTALSCAFTIPAGMDTATIQLEADTGTGPLPLTRVSDRSMCQADGWYDDGAKIEMCPDSCGAIREREAEVFAVEPCTP
jgi:hypothetical protein